MGASIQPARLAAVAVALAALALCLASCSTEASRKATVSGKTAYRGMGLEGVEVEVFRWEADRWAAQPSVKSGYHGSFRARLPPGRYVLRARTTLPSGPRISGTVELLVAGLRLDQLVLELRAAPD